MPFIQRHAARVLPLLLAGAIAGCGDDNDARTSRPPPTTIPPVATTDAFIAYVQTTVATSPDTEEPAAIDAVMATSPDDTEPVPVN